MLILISLCRRFLRARRFDVEGAWAQFKDTEDWRKDNAIEKLYENISVDSYEAARRMVRFIKYIANENRSRAHVYRLYSIPNGQAVAIAAEFLSTSSRSATWITRLSPLTTPP